VASALIVMMMREVVRVVVLVTARAQGPRLGGLTRDGRAHGLSKTSLGQRYHFAQHF